MKIGFSGARTVADPAVDADVANVTEDVLAGAQFAQQKLGTDYEILVEDNQNSDFEANASVEKLHRAGVKAIIGLATSDEVFWSTNALREAQLPAITSMATSPNLARHPEVFRTRPNDGYASDVLTKYLRTTDLRTIGTISEDRAYPLDCAEAFVVKGKAAGFQFVERIVKTHETDVSNLVRELKTEGLDAVFVNTQDEVGFIRILEQVRENLGDIQVFGSAMPGARMVRTQAGQIGEGVIYISEASLEDTLTDYGKQYLEEFTEWNGDEPKTGDYAIAFTFAAFFAFHDACQRGGELHEELVSGIYNDPVNGRWRFDEREISSQLEPTAGNKFSRHELKRLKWVGSAEGLVGEGFSW